MSGESERREAGRELDAEIAEEVFGEVEAHAPCGDGLTRTFESSGKTLADCDAEIRRRYAAKIAEGMMVWPAEYCGPEFSTRVDDALDVVEAMRAKGFGGFSLTRTQPSTWTAQFWNPEVISNAATPALAICLAALDALRSLTPEPAALHSPPAPTKEAT